VPTGQGDDQVLCGVSVGQPRPAGTSDPFGDEGYLGGRAGSGRGLSREALPRSPTVGLSGWRRPKSERTPAGESGRSDQAAPVLSAAEGGNRDKVSMTSANRLFEGFGALGGSLTWRLG
jgi:hypothetical protein